MPLSSGSHLGPYEIVAAIGAGGMGEVYRARDGKLNRDVALKILPTEFALDPERLARFKREAQVLASLDHPNIGAIYGFEDAEGIHALVLQLVEGPTLADRIAQGPIAIDDVLPIARQIAEALEAAHEQGIIHRDLKPANIKVRPDGVVKVLDFGLAKLADPLAGEAGRTGQAGFAMSQSPTMTTPAMMTGVGVILGTTAYVSPEQAKGRPADKRSDVWAFGCVLFEMLTGTRAFEGEDVSDTLAAILLREPDWTVWPNSAPAQLQAVVKRCLVKDRRARIPDVSAVRFMLDDAAMPHVVSAVEAPTSRRTAALWTLSTALFLATMVGAVMSGLYLQRSADRPVARFSIEPPPKTTFFTGGRPASSAVISPDGQTVAFTAGDSSGRITLWIRPLDSLAAQSLPGTDDARLPFWSPDSRFLAYFAGDRLMKVAAAGGTPQTVCAAVGGRGGAWSREGVIVFGVNANVPTALTPGASGAGLLRVPAAGGQPVSAMRSAVGQQDQRFPSFLPDGHHVLFYVVARAPEVAGVYVGLLDTGESKRLLDAESGGIYDAGRRLLLFVREGTLMAQPFDVGTLTLSDAPVPVAERVESSAFAGILAFSISDTGALVYGQHLQGNQGVQLAWIDRTGKPIAPLGALAEYRGVDLSPDGKRVVTHIHSGEGGDIWLMEPPPGPMSRLTFDASQENFSPIWSRDGSRIAFASRRNGKWGVYQKPANGTGGEDLLVESSQPVWPESWSFDGRSLVYGQRDAKTPNVSARDIAAGDDLRMVSLAGDRKTVSLVESPFAKDYGQVSPDGKWLAYTSTETGQPETYVRPFQTGAGKWQITTGGSLQPRWRGDGRELFYIMPTQTGSPTFMAVEVGSSGSTFEHGAPVRLFSTAFAPPTHEGASFGYAVSGDGQRFLLMRPPGAIADEELGKQPLVVVLRWAENLAAK